MRKDFIDAIKYAKYLAFTFATAFVLIFQFTAKVWCISFALSLYVVSFALMSVSMIMHAVEVFEAARAIKKEKMKVFNPEVSGEGTVIVDVPSELKGEEVEPVKLNIEKIWSIIGAIFFGLFAIFTFIVLVLY